MRMVDLSSYNPMISDWQAYIVWSKDDGDKSGIIIRVSEGTGFYDPTWQERSKEAIANGIDEIWYYCFSHPELNSVPKSEVDYLWQAVKNVVRPGKDSLMLDMEVRSNRATPAYALAWLNYAQSLTQKRIVFYSYLDYIKTMGYAACPQIAVFPLALAAYSGTMPSIPLPWSEALWWQNADNGIVPGISSPVDTDIVESSEVDSVTPDGPFYQIKPGYNGVPKVGNQIANALGLTWQNILAIPGNEALKDYDPTGPYLYRESDGYSVPVLVPGWQAENPVTPVNSVVKQDLELANANIQAALANVQESLTKLG